MSASKQIVIVGGGIIGLSVALYAARRGHRVTIVERGAPPGGACALGSAGMIVPSHFIPLAAPGMVRLGLKWMLSPESPFYIRPRASLDLLRWGWNFMRAANAAHVTRSAPLLRDLHFASRAAYEEWSDEFRDAFGLARKGLLMLCRTEHGLREEAHVAELARALGVPAEVLDRDATEALEPAMRFDVAGAVYYPRDCHLTPEALVNVLVHAVQCAGVDLRWETTPSRWITANGRVQRIETNRGDLAGDEFVLAAGVWSSDVAKQLGVRVPMQAGKGYTITLQTPPRLPSICAILTEARVAVTPMGGALRVGGTMELIAADEHASVVNPARVRGITNAIPQYFPEFKSDDFRDAPVWSGLRPCSPDGMPYVGRFARYANLSAATGHSMMGVSLAPVTGRLMAELLSDEKPSIDIRALSPDRYQ
ncbi:MAG TPA: FAD-dependent oxidoreductase [Thermoanaerobaculia bacterium]|nr:FAD-dependent oxidoreductase [Thermoanaerobaculia bacterium]